MICFFAKLTRIFENNNINKTDRKAVGFRKEVNHRMKKKIFLGLLCFAMFLAAQVSALCVTAVSHETQNTKATVAPFNSDPLRVQLCGDEGGGGRPGVQGGNVTLI